MTREEIVICKEFLNDADKTHSCNEYKLLMQLLEQEPILDKIRVEIIAESFPEDDEHSLANMVYLKDVLDILDKYKGESEGEE